jgi:hypothetical protein
VNISQLKLRSEEFNNNNNNNNSTNMLQILRGTLRNVQSSGVALGGNAERVCYLACDTRNALLEVSENCDDFELKSEAVSVGNCWLQTFEFLVVIVAWYGVLFIVKAVSKPVQSSGTQLGEVVTQITRLINFLKKEKDLLPPRSQHVEIAQVTEAGPKFR